jgi:hypothetical protein
MRLALILAASAGLLAAVATPAAAADVGRCVWEHIPRDERDHAIAPVAIPADRDTYPDAFSAAISDASENAALTACGVAADQHDAADAAFEVYAWRVWAEHRLFLYEPHIAPRRLDDAWNALGAELKQRIGREAAYDLKTGAPSPGLEADLNEAKAQVRAFLNLPGLISEDADIALRTDILMRAREQ